MTVQELIDELMQMSDKQLPVVLQVLCDQADFYEAGVVKKNVYKGSPAIWIIDR